MKTKVYKYKWLLKITVLVVSIATLGWSCTYSYSKVEAERSLKVLNSDITNLMTVSAELPELEALQFLYNQKGAPLPFKKSINKIDDSEFNLNDSKGTYVWNSDLNDFKIKNDKGYIDVMFQLPNLSTTALQILEYQSEPHNSRPDFPTKIVARMFRGDRETLIINHVGSVKDHMPEGMEATVQGEDFDIHAGFKRTKNQEDGTIDFYFRIKKGIVAVMDLRLRAAISYSPQGFYYNTIEFENDIFNHTISGSIDYRHIDPTATNYAESFNKNANIEIFESQNIKVGDIILAETGAKDLQEFKIQFKNNDQVLLKDYLPTLDKLYNLKY